MVNLIARTISQNALDDFSHLSATHAPEVLARNHANVGITSWLFFISYILLGRLTLVDLLFFSTIIVNGGTYGDIYEVVKRPSENRRARAHFVQSQAQ